MLELVCIRASDKTTLILSVDDSVWSVPCVIRYHCFSVGCIYMCREYCHMCRVLRQYRCVRASDCGGFVQMCQNQTAVLDPFFHVKLDQVNKEH